MILSFALDNACFLKSETSFLTSAMNSSLSSSAERSFFISRLSSEFSSFWSSSFSSLFSSSWSSSSPPSFCSKVGWAASRSASGYFAGNLPPLYFLIALLYPCLSVNFLIRVKVFFFTDTSSAISLRIDHNVSTSAVLLMLCSSAFSKGFFLNASSNIFFAFFKGIVLSSP